MRQSDSTGARAKEVFVALRQIARVVKEFAPVGLLVGWFAVGSYCVARKFVPTGLSDMASVAVIGALLGMLISVWTVGLLLSHYLARDAVLSFEKASWTYRVFLLFQLAIAWIAAAAANALPVLGIFMEIAARMSVSQAVCKATIAILGSGLLPLLSGGCSAFRSHELAAGAFRPKLWAALFVAVGLMLHATLPFYYFGLASKTGIAAIERDVYNDKLALLRASFRGRAVHVPLWTPPSPMPWTSEMIYMRCVETIWRGLGSSVHVDLPVVLSPDASCADAIRTTRWTLDDQKVDVLRVW